MVLVSSSLAELDWILPYLKTVSIDICTILPLSRNLEFQSKSKYPLSILHRYFLRTKFLYLTFSKLDIFLSLFICKSLYFLPYKLLALFRPLLLHYSSFRNITVDTIYIDFNGPSAFSVYLKYLFPDVTIVFFPHGTQPQDIHNHDLIGRLSRPRIDLLNSVFLSHNLYDYINFSSLYKLYTKPLFTGYPQYSISWRDLITSTFPSRLSTKDYSKKSILLFLRPIYCSLLSSSENNRLTFLVLDFLASLDSISVKISIHPRDLSVDRFTSLKLQYPFLSIDSRPATNALADCDLFISHYSSLIMDSLSISKPTIFVWPSSRNHTIYPSRRTRYCTEFGLLPCESLLELTSAYDSSLKSC